MSRWVDVGIHSYPVEALIGLASPSIFVLFKKSVDKLQKSCMMSHVIISVKSEVSVQDKSLPTKAG